MAVPSRDFAIAASNLAAALAQAQGGELVGLNLAAQKKLIASYYQWALGMLDETHANPHATDC